MKTDKMRDEFEAWVKRHHGIYSTGSVCGHYSNERVNQDWLSWCVAWQASRDSQVVELPPASGGVYSKADVIKALQAAGVSCK